MEKILVTTDFSANSKAGLRFAIQLASQYKFGLTFFHSYYVLIPTGWSNSKISEYKKIEEKKYRISSIVLLQRSTKTREFTRQNLSV